MFGRVNIQDNSISEFLIMLYFGISTFSNKDTKSTYKDTKSSYEDTKLNYKDTKMILSWKFKNK